MELQPELRGAGGAVDICAPRGSVYRAIQILTPATAAFELFVLRGLYWSTKDCLYHIGGRSQAEGHPQQDKKAEYVCHHLSRDVANLRAELLDIDARPTTPATCSPHVARERAAKAEFDSLNPADFHADWLITARYATI